MIRPARVEDAADIARVQVTTWRHAYRDLIDPEFLASLEVGRRADHWTRILEQGRSQVFVAEEDGGVVGFCSAGASDQEGWGEVYAIYVEPDHWGSGAGRALLGAGEETLTTLGHQRVLLWVLEGNARARRFYESQGWRLADPIRLETFGAVQVTERRYEKRLAPR